MVVDERAEPTHGSDPALVQACLDGAETAWETLVERYGRLVYAIARRSGVSPEDADDVFQVVFTTLFRRLHGLRDQTRLSSWLITVTHRESWRVARAGDLVLASVQRVGRPGALRDLAGHRDELVPGDEIVVAYGIPAAPERSEALVPDDLGPRPPRRRGRPRRPRPLPGRRGDPGDRDRPDRPLGRPRRAAGQPQRLGTAGDRPDRRRALLGRAGSRSARRSAARLDPRPAAERAGPEPVRDLRGSARGSARLSAPWAPRWPAITPDRRSAPPIPSRRARRIDILAFDESAPTHRPPLQSP